MKTRLRQNVRRNADRRGPHQGLQAQAASKMRVCVQVLPEAVHKVLQPDDTRTHAQVTRAHVQLRSLREELQEAG